MGITTNTTLPTIHYESDFATGLEMIIFMAVFGAVLLLIGYVVEKYRK